MTEIEKAYVAGFFDGEGCCLVTPNCQVRIIIAQKDPGVLNWIAKEYGGKLTLKEKGQNAAKLWLNGSIEIQRFLFEIKPYLRCKNFEVDLALQMIALNATNKTRPQAKNGLFLPNPNKDERERLFKLYRDYRNKTSQQSVALRKTLENRKLSPITTPHS